MIGAVETRKGLSAVEEARRELALSFREKACHGSHQKTCGQIPILQHLSTRHLMGGSVGKL